MSADAAPDATPDTTSDDDAVPLPADTAGLVRRRVARIALVLVVAAGLFVAYRMGVFETFAEPRALARSLVEMGWRGYLIFVLAYTLLQPFGVPGTIFVIAAPLIWPWPTAFALSMVGTMAASVVGFSFARFVAREWVSARIPKRLRKYDEALEERGFRTVVVLRLVLWMPQALHFFFGVSRVGFWTHFWGSVIGYIPPLFFVSYLGDQIFDASGNLQPQAWPLMGALVAVSAAVLLASHLYERRRRQRDA